MSADLTVGAKPRTHPAPRPAPRRGAMRINRGVVEKVAGWAALEMEGVGPPRPRGMRRLRRARAERFVHADVRGDAARLVLRVRLEYPRPIVTVAAALRRHVSRRVQDMTGLGTEKVDVIVVELAPGSVGRRRVR